MIWFIIIFIILLTFLESIANEREKMHGTRINN